MGGSNGQGGTELLDAAIAYARRQWLIIPLHNLTDAGCSCLAGATCDSAGKHPRFTNWQNGGTSSELTIRGWFASYPKANLGLPTGKKAGKIVLDVDPRSGGDESLADLIAEYGPLSDTWQVLTGGGGRHFYFAYPEVGDGETIASIDNLAPGLELKSDGRQVVLPPSVHPSGRAYQWEVSSQPDDIPLAPLPAWLLAMTKRKTELPRQEQAPTRPPLSAEQWARLRERCTRLPELELEQKERGVPYPIWLQLGTLAARAGSVAQDWFSEFTESYAPGVTAADRQHAAGWVNGALKGAPTCIGLGCDNRCQFRSYTDRETGVVRDPSPLRHATLVPTLGPKSQTQTKEVEAPKGSFPYTDYGNAERLVAAHGTDLHYWHIGGKWLVWDGKRWRLDDTAEIERRAKEVARRIYSEASDLTDGDARKALVSHARRSEAKGRIDAMIAMTGSEVGIPIRTDDLDANLWLLTVENGTVDLRTGHLNPHRRDDHITKLAPVWYDPTTECPTWHVYLERVFGGDGELIQFIQRAIGYSLTGNTSERCLFILHGVGRNGKSTLLQVLLALLGDYALRTPTSTLLAKRGEAIPNDVARLQGARLVAASEADQGRKLAESLVKDLTGQDRISARYMRAEWFDFTPACKVWLATNHRPEIRGTDAAIWDRIRLIPFTVRIPEDEVDADLLDKLKAEMPGILAWAVRGCLAWQKKRLGWPAAVRTATDEYRSDMDALAAYLDDTCLINPHAAVKVGELYESYKLWSESNGEKASEKIEKRAFGRLISERGFTVDRKGHGVRYWVGIGLRTGEKDLLGDDVTQGDAENGINRAVKNLSYANPKSTSPASPASPNRPCAYCKTFEATVWGKNGLAYCEQHASLGDLKAPQAVGFPEKRATLMATGFSAAEVDRMTLEEIDGYLASWKEVSA